MAGYGGAGEPATAAGCAVVTPPGAAAAGAGLHPLPAERIQPPRCPARALTAAPRRPAPAWPQVSGCGPGACSGNTGNPPRRPGEAMRRTLRHPPGTRPPPWDAVAKGYASGVINLAQ